MNKYILIILVILFTKITFSQDSTSVKTEIGIRTKKQVGFYWVNGLTAECSTPKIAMGSLHFGINITSSILGTAFRSNAIPTLETELSLIKYFRYRKSLQPITRLNFGFAKAFYGNDYSSIPSKSIVLSIETGLRYRLKNYLYASLYGGYNVITGNGINGLATIYPIYSGIGLNFFLATKPKSNQK